MKLKKSFYPNEEVEDFLKSGPKGKISERLNELILKGVSFEKQEQIALSYGKYAAELKNSYQTKRDQKTLSTTVTSSTMMMSQNAFEDEDDVEDFI